MIVARWVARDVVARRCQYLFERATIKPDIAARRVNVELDAGAPQGLHRAVVVGTEEQGHYEPTFRLLSQGKRVRHSE